MANVVAMEGAGLKENVNPAGGVWAQPKRGRKLGLGGFGGGEIRSRERFGVLAPNATLGNSGAVEPLEWLKDRMMQHKLSVVGKSQPELDVGSRHLRKLGSPVVDSKLAALGRSSAGLSSKELAGVTAGREPSSVSSHPSPSHPKFPTSLFRNSVDKLERNVGDHRISSGVQVAAKSRRPANPGLIEIYQDDPVNFQDQRDASRREVKEPPVDFISPGAEGFMARGLASRFEIEQQMKVRQCSPTNVEVSTSQLQQQQVNGKKPSSHGVGIGAWSETKRKGAPDNPTVQQYRNSSDQSETGDNGNLQLSSGGQLVESRSHWPASAGPLERNSASSVTSQDRREVNRREAKVESRSLWAATAGTLELNGTSSLTSQGRLEVNRRVAKVESRSHWPAITGTLELNATSSVTSQDWREMNRREAKVEAVGIRSPGVVSARTLEPNSTSSVTSQDRREANRREAKGDALRIKSPGVQISLELNGTSSVASQDRREVNLREAEVEAVGIKSPGAANRASRRPASGPNIDQLKATTLAILSRQIDGKTEVPKVSTFPRKSPDSVDDGPSSFVNRRGTPYKCRSLPLDKVEAARSCPADQVAQCAGKSLRKCDLLDEKDGGAPDVAVSNVSRLFEARNAEHYDFSAALAELVSKYGDCHSSERASCKLFADRGRSRPPPAKIQSDPTIKSGVGISKWPRSSAVQCQAGARDSPSEDVLQEDVSKWNSSNMDITAVAHGSALLTSEMTGASSSGSSATPSLMGDSSIDELTVKSHDSVHPSSAPSLTGSSLKSHDSAHLTPSAGKAPFHYERYSKLNGKKRFRSLGPASRVLKSEGVESCNSRTSSVSVTPVIESDCPAIEVEPGEGRISPVSVGPAIESDCSALTSEEEAEDVGNVEHPLFDLRKRKAERDLTNGYGDTSQMVEHITDALESVRGMGSIPEVPLPQGQHALGPRGMGSIPEDHPKQLSYKDNDGKVAHRLPNLKLEQISGPTKLPPRISAEDRFPPSGMPFTSWPTTLEARKAAPAGGRSSSAPSQIHNDMRVSQALTVSSYGYDRKRVSGSEAAQVRAPRNGTAESAVEVHISKLGSHVMEPVAEAGEESAERMERRRLLAADSCHLNEEGESAVDMSQDGFPCGENKENGPIPVVPKLINCLSSLSLEGKNILKTDQSRLPLHNFVNNSLMSSAAPTSRLSTSTSLEHGGARLSTSHHFVRSVPTIEQDSRQQGYSPSSKEQQRTESAGREVRISPLLAERPRAQDSDKVVGLKPTEQNLGEQVKAVPSDRPQDSGASAQQSSHITAKGNGIRDATASSQKRVLENSQFVWVNGKRYQKLGKIGKGGSSEVYKVIDSDCDIYALKRISLKGVQRSVARGYLQEIEYLERFLGKPNVIQLIACEVTDRTVFMEDYNYRQEENISEEAFIYMVLELGEIDLAGILSKKRQQMLQSNGVIAGNWLRFYWEHMLLAVKTIHDERIVHADLKPANFLMVKGELKLIDFGIAKAIQADTTHIIRDSQQGTLNYMSPEALMTNSVDQEGRVVKCGRASDIWSLGCILYQMVYGQAPFFRVNHFISKIQAITSNSYKIDFPAIPDPLLLDVMKKCLTWDRFSRPHISDLLQHPFLCLGSASQQLAVE